jgi:nucleotide-binding universal stress UspA family protein
MYKRILVAIDGSDTSDLALREAIRLAKDQKARLLLVHVVDVTPPPYPVPYMTTEIAQSPSPLATQLPLADYQKALQEGGEMLLATRATTAREAGVDVDSKLIIIEMLEKRIGDAIEEQSKQWRADLIVVGTHGWRGFQHLMFGSVAEGVIRVATKPVLLVRGT